MNRRYAALCLFSLLLCVPVVGSSATGVVPGAAKQVTQVTQAELSSGTALLETSPLPVVSEDVERFVAPLSDVEARRLLIERLREDTAGAEASDAVMEESRFVGVIQALQARSVAISERFDAMAQAVRNMPDALEYTLRNLTDDEGFPAVAKALAVLAVMIGLGLGAEWLLDTRLRESRRRLSVSTATAWSSRLGLLLLRVALDLLSVAVFSIIAYGISFAFFERFDPLRLLVTTYLAVIALVRVVHVIASFVLAPRAAGIRLLALDNRDATDLYRWVLVLTALGASGFFTSGLLTVLGMPGDLHRLFAILVGLMVTALLVALVWFKHERVARAMMTSGTGQTQALRTALAQSWHLLATAYLLLVWGVWAMNVLLQRADEAYAAVYSLLIVLAVPVADRLAHLLLEHGFRARTVDAPEVRERARRLQAVLQSGLRIVLAGIALLALAEAWGIGVLAAFETPMGARLAAATFNISVALLLAYAVWEIMKIYVDPQIAPREEDQSLDSDGEGGGTPASRAQTLLPLLRTFVQIVLVVMVTMIVLSSLGVNIGPLLAGAGVVGIAIGFGAQKLVQDIFSGIFFLVDDAFRVGEYVEAAGMKGTVEYISIRSMRLRHHLGTVQTVPFGEIGAVKNHSRDWVIVKQEIRLPYATDIEKVRKIIKRVGREMMENEDLSRKMLQPLKSQGVYRMEESALIVRMKFMAIPGEQWIPRREAFRRVRDALAAEGIHFAHREIRVRPAVEDAQQESLEGIDVAAGAGGAAVLAQNAEPR